MIGRLTLLVAAIVSAVAAVVAGIWAARRPGRPSSAAGTSAGGRGGGRGRSAARPTSTSDSSAPVALAAGASAASASEGERPGPADEPGAEDLRAIKGIGAVSADRLRAAGVTSVAQIAAWSDADVESIGAAIKVSPERIRREDWVGQARAATG